MTDYDISDFEAGDSEMFEDIDVDMDEAIEGFGIMLWIYAEQSEDIDTVTDSVGRALKGEHDQEDIERIDDALTALQEDFVEGTKDE